MGALILFIISLILGVIVLFFGISFSYGVHQADAREIDRHSIVGALFTPIVGPKKIAAMGEVKNARIYRKYFSTRGIVTTAVKWVVLVILLVLTIGSSFIADGVNAGREKTALKKLDEVKSSATAFFNDNKFVKTDEGIKVTISNKEYIIVTTEKTILVDKDGNIKDGSGTTLLANSGYKLNEVTSGDKVSTYVTNNKGITVIGTNSEISCDSISVETLINSGYLKNSKTFLRSTKNDATRGENNQAVVNKLSVNGYLLTYNNETSTYTSEMLVDTTMVYRGFSIFFLLAFLFIEQSVTVSIAEKKNMFTFPAALFGLVPFVGVVYYILTPGKKRIMVESISSTYGTKELIGRGVIYLEMLILCFVVLVPVVYLLGSALSDVSNIPNNIWPEEVSWKNFEILFSMKNRDGETIVPIKDLVTGEITGYKNAGNRAWFWFWFKNTFFVAVLSMIFSVLFITGTAYVFARFKFKGKKTALLTMLVLQMFPSFMSLVATYQLLKILNMLNNPYALILIYTSGAIPYNVWLIKGFLQNIPKDLDESATIDGANKLQIFFKIILPLSLPIITFVAVSQFMGPWMDYILPSYILKNPSSGDGTATQSWTMAIGLFSFISDQTSASFRPTLFAAGSLVIAIPITLLYVVFQRYLIEGITAGASKG